MNKNDLELQIPDYVFGRMSLAERIEFERAVESFPEIKQEIEELKNVFMKLDTTPISNTIEAKTRNTSVRVHDLLSESKQGIHSTWWRLSVLTTAVATVVLFLMPVLKNNLPIFGGNKSDSLTTVLVKPNENEEQFDLQHLVSIEQSISKVDDEVATLLAEHELQKLDEDFQSVEGVFDSVQESTKEFDINDRELIEELENEINSL